MYAELYNNADYKLGVDLRDYGEYVKLEFTWWTPELGNRSQQFILPPDKLADLQELINAGQK
jgi:hypothetical protein